MDRTDKLAGNWRANVVDNLDPMKSGRVKIDIPNLRLQGMWAEPAVQVGGSDIHGSYVIPRVGDKIFVFFDGGNIAHPIYFAMSPAQKDIPKAFSGGSDPVIAARNSGALHTSKISEPTTNATVEYPYGQGVKFPGGVLFIVDESGGQSKVGMYHPANSYTEYAGDGSHVGRIASDDYEIIMGDLFTYVGGSLTAQVMENIDLEVVQNYGEKIMGNKDSQVIGNVTEKVGGNVTGQVAGTVTETVVGDITVQTAGLVTLIANALTIRLATTWTVIAPMIVFTAATSITLDSPLVNIAGAKVLLGKAPAGGVLVFGEAMCPWCGGKVGPGSTTVIGSF